MKKNVWCLQISDFWFASMDPDTSFSKTWSDQNMPGSISSTLPLVPLTSLGVWTLRVIQILSIVVFSKTFWQLRDQWQSRLGPDIRLKAYFVSLRPISIGWFHYTGYPVTGTIRRQSGQPLYRARAPKLVAITFLLYYNYPSSAWSLENIH